MSFPGTSFLPFKFMFHREGLSLQCCVPLRVLKATYHKLSLVRCNKFEQYNTIYCIKQYKDEGPTMVCKWLCLTDGQVNNRHVNSISADGNWNIFRIGGEGQTQP